MSLCKWLLNTNLLKMKTVCLNTLGFKQRISAPYPVHCCVVDSSEGYAVGDNTFFSAQHRSLLPPSPVTWLSLIMFKRMIFCPFRRAWPLLRASSIVYRSRRFMLPSASSTIQSLLFHISCIISSFIWGELDLVSLDRASENCHLRELFTFVLRGSLGRCII